MPIRYYIIWKIDKHALASLNDFKVKQQTFDAFCQHRYMRYLYGLPILSKKIR